MEESKVKVLYIGGYSRSGSTILLRLLGQIEGFFSVGEMTYIWQRSFVENQLCGCGQPFRECEFWNAVIKKAFGGFDQLDIDHIRSLREAVQGNINLPYLMYPVLRTAAYRQKLQDYTTLLGKLYHAMRAVSGSNVIIDSSKVPPYAFVLHEVPDVDLHIVHLVRDSRATAYSWQRKKARPEIYWKKEYMERYSPIRSSLEWDVMNRMLQSTDRNGSNYRLLRYEDFVTQPRETLESLLDWLGQDASRLPFMENEHTVHLRTDHTVSGNPNRFQQGIVKIRPDVEWREKMTWDQRYLVTGLTWPLLWQYGYLGRNQSGVQPEPAEGKPVFDAEISPSKEK
jgi:hypothetical protein